MTRFRKHRKTVVVSFAEHEADILANLLRNLVELLYDGMPPRAAESSDPLAALLIDTDGPTSPPEDVVLQRLLPDAYKSDDQASAEFRRFTERGLREGKVSDALGSIESLVESAALPPETQVLGPVPLPDGAREPAFEGAEMLRMLLRTPRRDGLALARALAQAHAVRTARKSDAPVRIQIDPIDIG